MICILEFQTIPGPPICGENPGADFIASCIIATDIDDAPRQAQAKCLADLSSELYRFEYDPPPGKYPIAGNFLMLVA